MRKLISLLLIFTTLTWSQGIMGQSIINNDTILANQYVETAKRLLPAYQFDSINYYLDKAQPLYVKHLSEKSLKNAMVLHVKGIGCYYSAKYDSALVYYFKALQIRKDILGDNHILVATSFNNIGNIYLSKSQFDTALDYFIKSLEIRKQNLGEKHVDVAASYNNIGLVYYSKSAYDKALEYHFKSLALRRELLGEKHNDVAISYNNIAVVYFFNSAYDKASEYYQKSLDIWAQLYGPVHAYVATCYLGIGNVYNRKTDYDKALDYYHKSLEIMKLILGELHPNVASVYSNIGAIYFSKMEYDKALEYYFKCLEIQNQLFGEKHTDVASSYNNIGNVYLSNAEYDKALEYYFKSLAIRKELLDENHIDMALSYDNIGLVYNALHEYEQALEYHIRSMEIRRKQLGEKHIDIALSYNNLGEVYRNKKDFDKALDYFFKSLAIRKEVFGEKNGEVTNSFNNIGQTFLLKKDYSTALKYYHKGIVSCLRNYSDTANVNAVPPLFDYLDWSRLLTGLHGKAQLFADFDKTSTSSHTLSGNELALQHYQACDTLIDLTRKEISTLSDKMTLGEQASMIYEEALNVCEKLKNKSDKLKDKWKYDNLAFYFSEKNKSSVLLEALAGQEAQKFAGIPDSLLQKEHNFKTDIAFYTRQLAEPENLNSANTIRYRNNLFKLNRSYDSLIVVFEKQFARYHELKYNQKSVSVAGIQSLLDKRSAMISYMVGDSIISVFTITKKAIDIRQITKPAHFNDSIQLLRISMTQNSKRARANYIRIAHGIYDLIFPKSIDRKIENLLIIPDNVLATIPFEALLTEPLSDIKNVADFAALPYLLNKYIISYSYSSTLFERTFPKEITKDVEITQLNDWLAYAPVFSDENTKGISIASRELLRQLKKLNKDSTLTRSILLTSGDQIPPLPGTESEVKNIFNQFDQLNYKAKVEFKGNATEQSIKSGMLDNYRIIHFATHGFVNSEKPELSGIVLAQDSIGGQDGILFSGEIYNLKLNASLVVLSACETGLGQIKKGEGIIGLTRALLYAGTKNIMVSLWQVSDESTSNLMIDFYKNLLGNKEKNHYAQNLRQAKLKMIKEGQFAHPFYWSPFILIGK
jgi:CHAT domain-containing protein/tetratricopeptide (TPR) repeat protein